MGIKIKKLRTNLKKEDIALSKGYMRWYRVVEDEVRLFINERAVNNNKEDVNMCFKAKIKVNLKVRSINQVINRHDKLSQDIALKSFMKNIRI